MNPASELSLIDDYIDRIHAAQSKMKDDDAIRAVRTLSHLEARKIEINTGKWAGSWDERQL